MVSRAKLIAYGLPKQPLEIRPAPYERDWMDATSQRYAYRCLPLTIANAHGWEILCPAGFSAWWGGGQNSDAIRITPDDENHKPAITHFGYGVLTFHIPAVFRTDAGYDLMVQGPINRPKDAIAPLSGMVETDWTPFTFTMNWQFTRPNTVIRFEKGEPFCHVFPARRGELEKIMPEVRPIADDPELKAEFDAWTASRANFLDGLKKPDSEASAAKWQKHYYRGQNLDGTDIAADDHRTKIRLQPFRKSEDSGEG
ncbi:DUF6065 family protein [Rhizorhabdus argentea]|uniref:DUF6065 family protein n=1 Tax=Rhizorhabdus argentea TaxID=1387174 RepID=UPI0030EE8BFB